MGERAAPGGWGTYGAGGALVGQLWGRGATYGAGLLLVGQLWGGGGYLWGSYGAGGTTYGAGGQVTGQLWGREATYGAARGQGGLLMRQEIIEEW